jgi:hypothetical protein
MRRKEVSVAMVVGAWESHVQGEGPHRGRRVRSNPGRCEGVGILAKADGALRPVRPLMGSPCAVKAARTVTTGGMGRHRSAVRPVPTHSRAGVKMLNPYGSLCSPRGEVVQRKSRRQSPPTGDPAEIRGWATTLLASVGCRPQSRHEYAYRSRHAVEGGTPPERRLCR